MSHNPSIALTTPLDRFAPLPHTDRLFSCDQLLHVITVGSVAAEFLLVKQALDPASQAHLIRVFSLSHRPTHSAVPAAAQQEHRRSARAGGEQARPCPPRPALLLLTHLGHVAAPGSPTPRPQPTCLMARDRTGNSEHPAAMWQGHRMWPVLAGGKLKELPASSHLSRSLLFFFSIFLL